MKRLMVPPEVLPQVLNRAAQLGVEPRAVVLAATQKWLWQISEDEAAACESTPLYEAWVKKHQAEKARAILNGHKD